MAIPIQSNDFAHDGLLWKRILAALAVGEFKSRVLGKIYPKFTPICELDF